MIAKPNLSNQVLEAQKSNEKICQTRKGKETEFSVKEDGFLYYRDRVCVPNDDELKKSILKETTIDILLCILVALKCIGIYRLHTVHTGGLE